MANLHADAVAVLDRVRKERMGFLTCDEVEILASDLRTRLTQLLVRCGGCRFTCAAQDAKHLITIIGADGRDYVRDVALLARGVARV